VAKIKARFINNSQKHYTLVIFQLKTDSKGENLAERAVYYGFIPSGNYQTVELEDISEPSACVPGTSYEIGDIVSPADRRKLMQLTNYNRGVYEVSDMDQIRS
jgi:hypothetical protein